MNKVACITGALVVYTGCCLQEIIKTKGYSEYYMSVWDWKEIDECRRLLYPTMPEEEVRSRYEQWGGLPRYVFDKIGVVDQLSLSKAIDKSSVQLVREAAFGASPNPQVSDRLLHTVVENDFVTTRMQWASTWVCEKCLERMLALEKDQLLAFVRVARGPELGPLRGKLWEGEAYSCRTRSIDGTFTC